MSLKVLYALSALLLAISSATFLMALRRRRYDRAGWSAVIVLLSCVATYMLGLDPESDGRKTIAHRSAESVLPKRLEAEFGYTGSSSCRECHVEEHESWRHSYHSKMPRLATPESVMAPFDGVTLEHAGSTYHLEQRGDEFWVELDDPDFQRQVIRSKGKPGRPTGDVPRVHRQIVMTTGSHHKQTYWLAGLRGRLERFRWNYRLDDQRWIPMEYDFLVPQSRQSPNSHLFSYWNNGCIQCHTVAGKSRQSNGVFNSRAAELGIGCEACHGPGAKHVQFQENLKQNPPADSDEGSLEDPIVNPVGLPHQRAAQVCAQCHGFFIEKKSNDRKTDKPSYHVGGDLHEVRHIIRYSQDRSESWMQGVLKTNPNYLENRFWDDGTCMVTGRPYTGLLESACFQRGEISCISCHSMHQYEETDDQLQPGKRGNKACLECHTTYADNIQEHTHHLEDSTGSLCYNCHMPHTTYGLFKAVHSHRIDSPSVANSVRSGRPNACNLCHLNRTQAWSSDYLSKWYGLPEVELEQDDHEIAASLLWLLRGDAAQRAILAWHMGWEAARQTSGQEWLAPFLAHCLDDPYSAVRNVARRSIRKLPGFEKWDYDILVPVDQQIEAKLQVLELWRQRTVVPPQAAPPILISPTKVIDQENVSRLQRDRDNSPILINE